MIKKVFYIFIPVLAVLLMSHNSFALTTTFDLSNYEIVDSISTAYTDCSFIGGSNLNNDHVVNCSATINNATSLKSIITESTFITKKNDILNFYLVIWSPNNLRFMPRFVDFTATNQGWDVIDYHEVLGEDIDRVFYSFNGHISSSSNDLGFDLRDTNTFYRVFDISLRSRNDSDKHFGLDSAGGLFRFDSSDNGSNVYFSMRNYRTYRYNGSAENKEVENKTQDAANNSATSGGSSASDSQTATSSLLSVIASGVGAITSASPTNCKINGNMGNLNVGNIDLCANPVPTFMALIGSIIAVLVVLPLVILLFNRFISIIRSFQR